jgi:pimeloyl-ACP methyl ester carboxylesterase
MKVYEGARGLDGAIVIVDGKPLPPRHGEPTSRRNSPRNRWFESVSLQRGVTCEPDFFDRRWPAGTIRGPSAHRAQAGQGSTASIAILNHIADSRLVLLNNCGHWPPFEKPAEWTAQVLAFLKGY